MIATATAFGTATGATAGSQAAIDRETWSLAATAKTLAPGDPLIANLQNYIALINTIPGSVETNFNAGGRTLHAQGGVFSSAHVGMVAEDGPEAIIPLSKPGRAADVMRQAGLIGSGTGGDVTIVVNVQGSVVTQQQLDDAIYQGLLRRKQLQGSLNLS